MDKISENLIDEIISVDPKIINISGNTDPTYASSEFCYILIDFNGDLFQTGIRDCPSKLITITKKEWISKTIKDIHPDYEIRRVRDGFNIDRVDSVDEEINNDFGYWSGGDIEVIV